MATAARRRERHHDYVIYACGMAAGLHAAQPAIVVSTIYKTSHRAIIALIATTSFSPLFPTLHSQLYTLRSYHFSIFMSFFKRKDKSEIPPVASEQAARNELFGSRSNSSSPRPPPSYRSDAAYVPSRDGDPYSSNAPRQAFTDRYTKSDSVGDVYSRTGRDVNQDRSELFSGYKPREGGGSGRFFNDGPAARPEPTAGEENEEDVEGIKQQLRFTKQESVNSTRNALRLAREAEETARNTLNKLGDQSGACMSVIHNIDLTRVFVIS